MGSMVAHLPVEPDMHGFDRLQGIGRTEKSALSNHRNEYGDCRANGGFLSRRSGFPDQPAIRPTTGRAAGSPPTEDEKSTLSHR